MSLDEPTPTTRKTALIIGLICTFLYLALFLPSFYVSMLIPSLYENANMTHKIGIIIIFLSICVPVGIIVGIRYIWTMYFKESYRAMYFFCLFPLLVALAVLIVTFLIKAFFL